MGVKRKQLSFDLDIHVCKKILGDANYTKAYKDMRKFFESNDCTHIEGSVYMSNKGMSNLDILHTVSDLLTEYPYLSKCIRSMHQADISNVHSLEEYFEYDGTPGTFAV